MRAFVINLDSAPERWADVEKAFSATSMACQRIPAVNGRALQFPHPDFSEPRYRWFHGREFNPGEVGCYLSHALACRTFLESGEAHGLICEDDISFTPQLEHVIAEALLHRRHWNILRLAGLGDGVPATMVTLSTGHSLCIGFGRLKGTGAYLVDRAGAQAIAKGMLPMWLPFDHAIDREWRYGLKAAYVHPWPISQTELGHRSSIQCGGRRKLLKYHRWVATYPYQCINEISRWLVRSLHFLKWKLAKA